MLNNILFSLSLGLNLVMTTLVTFTYMEIPFSMDLIRNQYLKDVRFFAHTACLHGTDYPPEYRVVKPGFNENSPMQWCNNEKERMESEFMNHMFKLGRKTP